MRHSNLRLLLPLLAALLLPAAVQAGMYKWVDPQGVTHYGDQPPPGQAAQPVAPPPPPASSAPAEAKALKQSTESSDKAREEQQKAAAKAEKQRQAEAKRAENCKRIQERLDHLRTHNRLMVLKDGALQSMSEEQRQSEITKLESEYAKNCSGQQ